MNLPNFLTVCRFFLTVVMVSLLFWREGAWAPAAFPVFLVGSLTDYWDGRLARQRNQITRFGTLMDPIADKALTLGAFTSFWALGLVSGLWVLVVAVRDIIVTVPRLFSAGKEPARAVRSSGKQKTAFQMIYISLVLAYVSARRTSLWKVDWDPAALAFAEWGMILIAVLTIWSGLRVFFASRPTMVQKPRE